MISAPPCSKEQPITIESHDCDMKTKNWTPLIASSSSWRWIKNNYHINIRKYTKKCLNLTPQMCRSKPLVQVISAFPLMTQSFELFIGAVAPLSAHFKDDYKRQANPIPFPLFFEWRQSAAFVVIASSVVWSPNHANYTQRMSTIAKQCQSSK